MNTLSKKLLKAVKKNGIISYSSFSKTINGERKSGQVYYLNMSKVNNKNSESNTNHFLGIHICQDFDLSVFVEHKISLNNNPPHSDKFSGYSKLHTIDDPNFLVKFNKHLNIYNKGASTITDIDKILDDLLAD